MGMLTLGTAACQRPHALLHQQLQLSRFGRLVHLRGWLSLPPLRPSNLINAIQNEQNGHTLAEFFDASAPNCLPTAMLISRPWFTPTLLNRQCGPAIQQLRSSESPLRYPRQQWPRPDLRLWRNRPHHRRYQRLLLRFRSRLPCRTSTRQTTALYDREQHPRKKEILN